MKNICSQILSPAFKFSVDCIVNSLLTLPLGLFSVTRDDPTRWPFSWSSITTAKMVVVGPKKRTSPVKAKKISFRSRCCEYPRCQIHSSSIQCWLFRLRMESERCPKWRNHFSVFVSLLYILLMTSSLLNDCCKTMYVSFFSRDHHVLLKPFEVFSVLKTTKTWIVTFHSIGIGRRLEYPQSFLSPLILKCWDSLFEIFREIRVGKNGAIN